MRHTFFVLALVLTFGCSSLPAESRKPLPDVGSGHVGWFDIATPDLGKAKEFYAKLFGWEYTPLAATDLAVEIVSRGDAIGTLRVGEGKLSVYNGVVYVQVDDIRASCSKATDLGGTIVPGFPFDLPEGRGAVGLAIDPTGHPFGMYSRTPLAAVVK